MATLMIAANLPDVDAISAVFGRSLAWRRGWTHGPISLLVLPVLLALAAAAFDRWQARRGTRPPARAPVRMAGLITLAYVGILSHPLMDFLNTYGIRCLMPLSDRWFYGDALFIIDVWVWSALGAGLWISRRRERSTGGRSRMPAIAALTGVTIYAAAMGAASVAAERMVARDVAARGFGAPVEVVASPVPVNPLRRRVVFDTGEAFGFGDVTWTPFARWNMEPALVPTNMDHPAVLRAAAVSRRAADFISWSRLPFAEVQEGPGGTHVTIGDARYNRRPGDGFFIVRTTVPAAGQ